MRAKNEAVFGVVLLCLGALISFIVLSTTVVAAVQKGSILDGHATTPKDSDVASSKYAVIAQFKSNSKRIIIGASTRKSNRNRDLIVEPPNTKKGDIKALYTNVATYKGRTLDFELVVTDWQKAGFNGGEYFLFYDTHIGFKQGGYEYVSLEGTYKYHDTGKPATDLTGSYMTVNDLDSLQYMSFKSGMANKIDKLYAYDNSWVNYWKTGRKVNIGSQFRETLGSNDKRGFVTMLVSGYQFDFEWAKDWSHYNLNQTINWRTEQFGQYFSYKSEKPVRTELLEPTKKITKTNGRKTESNSVTVSDSFTYNIYHTVPSEYPKFYYDSYVMRDPVHNALQITRVRVYDGSGRNVSNKFSISTSGHVVKVRAHASALNAKSFYGEDYRVEIKVRVKASSALINYADGDGSFLIYNTANVTIDGKSKPTNRVKTKVTLSQTELGMKKIRIYTNKANNGLPVILKVTKKNMLDMYNNDTFSVKLYRKNRSSKTLMAKKTIKLEDLDGTINMKIPSSKLRKGTVKNYEAVLTNYDTNHIKVDADAKAINTDGYTSKESMLTIADAISPTKPVIFKGVVMTERELGQNIKKYYETLEVDYTARQSVKSGYGYKLYGKVIYQNDLMQDLVNKFSINRVTDTVMTVDNGLLDKSLAFYNPDSNKTSINLLRKDEINRKRKSIVTYQGPHIYLAQASGFAFTERQKDKGAIDGRAIDAGNKLYVPVWINELGEYDLVFKNKKPLGVHRMNFKIKGIVDVTAYMFAHIDSETPNRDELLIHPMVQSEIPGDW